MKIWIACASALVLVSACGVSKEATAALTAMQLTDGKSGTVRYASKTGMGDKVTLNDVVIGDAKTPGDGLKAKSLTMAGLKLTKAGKPVFEEMTLKDITPEKDQPGLTFNLASISVKHPNESTGVYLASAFTKEGPGTPPPFDSWELQKFSVNGLKVAGDLKKMGQGEGSFNVAMDEVSVADLKKTIFGAARLAGLKGDFNIPAEAGAGFPIVGKFDFGTGDVKGFHGGLFADAISAGASAGTSGDTSQIGKAQSDMLAKMTSPIDPGYDAIAWSPMSFEASGVKLTTTKLDQKTTRNANGVVTAISSPQTKISLSANAADGQLGSIVGGALGAIGYQTIELYGSGDATYDPASETTRYAKYDFGLTDGFDLQMTGGFTGLLKAITSLVGAMTSMETNLLTPAPSADPSKPATPAEPDMSGIEQLKVVDLDITLTDKSLVNRLLNLSSMLGSPDPEALRKDIIDQIKAMGGDLSSAGIDKSVSEELTAAIAAFVKQPGTLNIKLKPAQPVALMAKDQKLTKQSLGFSASATPGNNAAPPPINQPAAPAPSKPK